MSLLWFVLSIILVNLASNMECEAERTSKSGRDIEREFLAKYRGSTKVETKLAGYSEAENYGKLKELCQAVVGQNVVEGNENYPMAWFKEVKISFRVQPSLKIDAFVVSCPFRTDDPGVLFIRESSSVQNPNCYNVLKTEDNETMFIYESCI